MPYNRFWMLWLPEHAPKSTQYQFDKFDWVTPKNIWEGAKDILKLLTLSLILGALVTRGTSGKYRFTKLGQLTERDPKEGAKIILRLLFLTRRWVLIKKPHREHWRKWLIFYFVCTGFQSTPQNLVNIDLPDLVGWLEETLRKEQNLFWGYSFWLEGEF